MGNVCYSLLATVRVCTREGIVSNIVSAIQLLFTTSACPASQPSKERQRRERGINTHTHIYVSTYAALYMQRLLSGLGAGRVEAPGEPASSVCGARPAILTKQPTAKE